MRSHIIGIAGPSSSGKSELAQQLVQRLPGTSIVSLDSYYRGMEEIPLDERKKVNFDHPDAFDTGLLMNHIEALRAGAAVVASDVDGIPEDVTNGETALLVKPDSAAELTQALTNLLRNPDLRLRLADKSRELSATRFSAEVFARAIRATYAELGFTP